MEIWMATKRSGESAELVKLDHNEYLLFTGWMANPEAWSINLDRKNLKDLHDAIATALWGQPCD